MLNVLKTEKVVHGLKNVVMNALQLSNVEVAVLQSRITSKIRSLGAIPKFLIFFLFKHIKKMHSLISRIYCITIFIIIIQLRLFAQDSSNLVHVSGKFNGFNNGKILMLSDDGDTTLAKGEILKGNFDFSVKIKEEKLYLFKIIPGNWSFRAFIESKNIMIIVDTLGAKHYFNKNKPDESWALIWHIKQKGSEIADEYEQFRIETFEKDSLIALETAYTSAINSEEDGDKKSELIINGLINNQKAWIENYIKIKPNSKASPFILMNIYKNDPNKQKQYYIDALSNLLAPANKTYYFKLFRNQLGKLSLNEKAPEFTLRQASGSLFNLYDLKGNYTLVDFWASWCGPCRKNIIKLKNLNESYSSKGLKIVGISTDRDENKWRKALELENMPWLQVIDTFPSPNRSSLVSELYGIETIPYYILIDPTGKIEKFDSNIDKIKSYMEGLFKDNANQ